MVTPPSYIFALNSLQIRRHFPNLIQGTNFDFTSLQTDEYNCIAWATEITDDWIQDIYDENGNYDVNVEKYVTYFSDLGFEKTENITVEPGKDKIAIYADGNNDFKHVARQLPNGRWTSKLGDWEDIEHNTLEIIAGESYGQPIVIMTRNK